ncbi:hypothetical protein [Marinactinospora rubrisoli]|uniref:Uncharacterized protein n=1 Tax=Marinactinospora rubrisoli TaxID=2715399 RepID=A0ABW2KQ45_9ACTN
MLLPRVTEQAVTELLNKHFGTRPDLVEAITADPAFGDLVDWLNREYDSDLVDISDALWGVATEMDAGLADWVATRADQPAVWLISRTRS